MVERGSWPQPLGTNALLWAEGTLYSASGTGLKAVEATELSLREDFSTYLQTRTGILLAATDGRIWLRDDEGLFELGRRHSFYQRFDQSIDGRFVMATTQTGEVLLWDLVPLRPQSIRLGPDETAAIAALCKLVERGFDEVPADTAQGNPCD